MRNMNDLFNINWHSVLLGDESWTFLYQVIIRTAIMFIIVLISLRLIGKRAVMQGVFEVALIIALGSAAGDAMFYSKVGLLPTILVFLVIIILYKIINHFMAQNSYFERFLQGQLVHLIENGEFIVESLKKEELGINEIFSDLRLMNVSHLGQVKNAYIEPSGSISVFFYPDNETRYGLPILPQILQQQIGTITVLGHYSCSFCGNTEVYTPPQEFICLRCEYKKCIISTNSVRAK